MPAGAGRNRPRSELPNLYAWKREYLTSAEARRPEGAESIGIPLALGTYELAPLWHALFTAAGLSGCASPALSNRATYEKGQFSIPV